MHPNESLVGNLLWEFLSQVRLPRKDQPQPTEKPWTIILTGSTGSIGTHMLSVLQTLPTTKVCKIFCLNRSDDAREKQADMFRLRGLPPLDDRISFLKATWTPKFGLVEHSLTELMDEVTMIIHNAWPVNFLMPLEEFRPHIEGVRDLLQFAYRSPHHPPFLYISSLGIAYSSNMNPIPEEIFDDFSAIAGGYPQSKYIAERMVEVYAQSTGLSAAVLRFGQIAGPVRSGGVWPHREWFPTLLRASKHLDALPGTLGKHNAIDWVPVDILSQIAVEIAEYITMQPVGGSPLVFNIANPKTIPFEALLPQLRDVTGNTVPCEEWVSLLQRSMNTPAASKPPGWKLLELYRTSFTPGRLPIETETCNMTLASKTARSLRPVNGLWVLLWLEQWGIRRRRSATRL